MGNQRLTLRVVFKEFLSNVFEWEYPVLKTMKDMTIRPGLLCRDYVKGIRKPYSRPFQYYLITLAVFYLVMLGAGLQISDYSQDFTPEFAEGEIGEHQRILLTDINDTMNEYSKIFMFLMIPLYALCTWMLFRKSGFNYAENFIMNLYVVAHLSLISVVCIPISFYEFSYYFFTSGVLGMIYFVISLKQFFQVSMGVALLKGLLTYILAMIIFAVISISSAIVFIRFFVDYDWI
ncbi:MAG: DUF3667 domain-containing protein [Flavobacteriales bacterium]|nr:DUF3667 domain-containing protein [Flavobacteriales bacterium]